MIVKFATLCDTCKARSPEYTSWARCLECGEDVCPECMIPESVKEGEGETLCFCKRCNQSYDDEYPVEDTRDPDYERAAALARNNDFEDTDGKDWT